MGEIRFNYKNDQLFLEGAEGERFKYYGVSQKNNPYSSTNFYRIDNNFGYVQGKINFSSDCDNNVVISDQNNTTISKTKNSFISINGGCLEVLPIDETKIAYTTALDMLKDKRIRYNIPQKILKRERLKRKKHRDLEKILFDNYRLHPTQIKKINKSAKENGIFYISDSLNKYVFKYLGEDKEKINATFEITKSIPNLFPLIEKTKKGDVSVRLEDGFYGLEKFIEEGRNSPRGLMYFFELGRYMAIMHKKLLRLIEQKPELKASFLSSGKHLSDSNLVSLGIDLALGGFGEINLELDYLAKLKLSRKIKSFPEYLIHGDLNGSNIIITPKGLRFIDLERIKISRRVCELESPLIYGGNMTVPSYVKGSLKSLVEGYNIHTKQPLINKEKRLGRDLVKYALIKNFVIRNIRRGEKSNSKRNLLKNLSSLDKEVVNNG